MHGVTFGSVLVCACDIGWGEPAIRGVRSLLSPLLPLVVFMRFFFFFCLCCCERRCCGGHLFAETALLPRPIYSHTYCMYARLSWPGAGSLAQGADERDRPCFHAHQGAGEANQQGGTGDRGINCRAVSDLCRYREVLKEISDLLDVILRRLQSSQSLTSHAFTTKGQAKRINKAGQGTGDSSAVHCPTFLQLWCRCLTALGLYHKSINLPFWAPDGNSQPYA